MKTDFLLLDEVVAYKKAEHFPFRNETYQIIGACMEVHRTLGKGFLEIVYKDALEYEFKLRGIPYEREKMFEIPYKDIVLRRQFPADFFCFNEIIVEAKAKDGIVDEFYTQTINYLAASGKTLALLVNFGEDSLVYKRIILSKHK